MTEMIERVAGALVENNMRLSWEEARDLSRAAIEAMREPTETMKKAVESDQQIQSGLDDCNQHDIPDKAWTLMIDAALNEKSPTP